MSQRFPEDNAMKSLIGNAFLLGLAAATAAVVGCSSSPSTSTTSNGGPGVSQNDGATGAIHMNLSLGNDTTVNSVQYVLQNGSTVVQSGTVSTANSNSIDFQLGAIPAGTGYTVQISAASPDGGVDCIGSSLPFSVIGHSTVTVNVQLVCTFNAADAGNVQVIGQTSYCGTWQSVSTVGPGIDAGPTNGSEVYADGVSQIVVTAAANGAVTSQLAYNWSVASSTGAGVTLGATTGNGTEIGTLALTCNPSTQDGGAVIQLTVTDNGDAGAVTCPGALSTTTLVVSCDATLGCTKPFTACGTGASTYCANLSTDSNNCGTCGHVLPANTSCVGGVETPNAGYAICGGTVTPITTNTNCGACGVACTGNKTCTAPGDGGAYACAAPTGPAANCSNFLAANPGLKSTSTTCSTTELTLYEKDTTGGCLGCAFSSFCLDDTGGDHGQECEDLASTTTAPNGASQTDVGAGAVSNCQATLACEVGVNTTTGVAGTAGVDVGGTETLANAFCGTVANATCQGAISTSGINGACDSVIEAGLPSTFTVGSSVLSNIANTNYSAGQAGSIVACLINAATPCTTCLH
jgi:hypothetical protein